MRRHRWLALWLASASSCLGDWGLEREPFPCRAPADCAEGYFCHPQRYVCVPIGTSTTAIAGDAGGGDVSSSGGGLGAACGAGRPCADGTCVDGVCCAAACAGPCERCDIVPGVCSPAPAGTDPDLDCGGTVDCTSYTFGLQGDGCYAMGAGSGVGVCDGQRTCRVNGCETAGVGALLVRCAAGCLAAGACPPAAPASAWDQASEACAAGAQCEAQGAFAGCCSAAGACCPAPLCSDQDPGCVF